MLFGGLQVLGKTPLEKHRAKVQKGASEGNVLIIILPALSAENISVI